MSENDRMERARRIRRMREGQRDGEDEESDADEPDETQADDATTQANGDQPDAADAGAEETAETASVDGGAAAATAEPEESTEDTEDDAAAETAATPDSEVDEAVENVSGTRAELPSAEQMEAAMEQTMEQVEEGEADDAEPEAEAAAEESAGPAAGIAGDADVEQTQEADTRILEFTLDDEQYCLDIQYIEEIVKHTNITRVPNTPEFVEGVVDLRGQITTILNPKVTIDKDDTSAGDLIVVFDAEAFEDQGHIGWVVDDVRQVSPISEDAVNDPPMQEEYINGVIDRDDGEFVIWTTPDLALEEAE